MKFGFFGGAILLILTLIFSYIAIQNNKMAREITVNAFELKQPQKEAVQNENQKELADLRVLIQQRDANNTAVKAEGKWDKFDEKFKDFDKKFENF